MPEGALSGRSLGYTHVALSTANHIVYGVQAMSSTTDQVAGKVHDVQVPQTFRRLVARRTGKSFRDVAEIETISTPKLHNDEVSQVVICV